MTYLTRHRDQELRFTVHDSADYYQLKVSVFNDDRRTDLIGETWINLQDVIVRGGGRSDGWHNLNCKGRYAGEIRIELTYYDTRPKDEQQVQTLKENVNDSARHSAKETTRGPRQPKQVSRRPLPVDPTDAVSEGTPNPTLDGTEISAVRQTPPRSQEYSPHRPVQYSADSTRASPTKSATPQSYRHQPQTVQSLDPASGRLGSQPEPRMVPPVQHAPENERYEIYDPSVGDDYIPGSVLGRYDEPPRDNVSGPPPPPAHAIRHATPDAVSAFSTSTRHSYYSQGVSPTSQHQSAPDYNAGYSHTPHRHRDEQVTRGPRSEAEFPPQPPQQPRHHSHDSTFANTPVPVHYPVNEDIPPPPPAHRTSAQKTTYVPPTIEDDDDSPMPAPLNLAQGRRRSGSPAVYYEHRPHSSGYSDPSSYPIPQRQDSSPAGPPPVPYNQLPWQGGNGITPSPFSDAYRSVPPSLVPGYDPSMVERNRQNKEIGPITTPQGGGSPSRPPTGTGSYERYGSQSELSQPGHDTIDDGYRSRSHRSTASMGEARSGGPEPVKVPRKSVSPRPSTAAPSNGLSGVPFSPDSYDALNPNAGHPSFNESGAQYRSPEEAEETYRLHKRQAQRGRPDEPIIGADGQVIDPSDHLPSDTWAPEPERKTPTRPPQSETRSRPVLQGAQPMPPSSRRPRQSASRPQSIAGPVYSNTNDPQTPNSVPRNRLQKGVRGQASSPALTSSPAGPYTSNHSTPRSMAVADSPLREHENYGRGNSPSYSPYGNGNGVSPTRAPPIPAKIPVQTGRDDYSALSEELSTIDIGSVGRRGPRRGQY